MFVISFRNITVHTENQLNGFCGNKLYRRNGIFYYSNGNLTTFAHIIHIEIICTRRTPRIIALCIIITGRTYCISVLINKFPLFAVKNIVNGSAVIIINSEDIADLIYFVLVSEKFNIGVAFRIIVSVFATVNLVYQFNGFGGDELD